MACIVAYGPPTIPCRSRVIIRNHFLVACFSHETACFVHDQHVFIWAQSKVSDIHSLSLTNKDRHIGLSISWWAVDFGHKPWGMKVLSCTSFVEKRWRRWPNAAMGSFEKLWNRASSACSVGAWWFHPQWFNEADDVKRSNQVQCFTN